MKMVKNANVNAIRKERRRFMDWLDTEKQLSRYENECGEVKVIQPSRNPAPHAGETITFGAHPGADTDGDIVNFSVDIAKVEPYMGLFLSSTLKSHG